MSFLEQTVKASMAQTSIVGITHAQTHQPPLRDVRQQSFEYAP